MFSLPGIVVRTQICESAASLVYRAIREDSHQPIIIKLLKQEYPTPEELSRYRTEYQITKSLNLSGVVKVYELQKYKNSLVMLLEDFGGDSLQFLNQQQRFNLQDFLQIAIAITESLAQIHAVNIIHKDINPSNIVFNPVTKELKIIDFGISTQLTRENPTITDPNILEGTIAYISPEQTGRMNRSLDYRTDFYSLGVTFYELLTNQLPFLTTDALELVHYHIAKQPLTPSEINPDIPPMLSAIVMKLIAKTAEERYQSALGIKADLENCLNQLSTHNYIANFQIGSQDIYDKFQIPQKLYGREKEIKILLDAFTRISVKSSEVMLVIGYSGIGKSALVQELYKPITQKRGYFISGKFDQYQRNIPYSAIVNAFKQLIKQLLTKSAAELQQCKQKILTALGVNSAVIIDVIPELELIIGEQPPVLELGAVENANRFNLVFQNFIKVFTTPSHPLVIFLDDLQWADGASLKLMQILLNTDISGLLLICAYRENEVDASHPLMLALDSMTKNGVIVNSILLSPLDLNTVVKIIEDTLKYWGEEVLPLANLLHLKTGGNPFFLNEFFKSLYTEELLRFNLLTQKWEWDLEQIQVRDFTDNVVELMINKIKTLPENSQDVLKLASCIGNQFDTEQLALIANQDWQKIAHDLYLCVSSGFLVNIGNNKNLELAHVNREFAYEFVTNTEFTVAEYKFTHDRIQQAAYLLIPESERADIHYRIGKIFLKNTQNYQHEELIFTIINQINFGVHLITEQSEKDELAQLNLIAGKKAKTSVAYQPALNYLEIGIDLLGTISWQRKYNLSLYLHEEAAEVAYLNGDFEKMTVHVNNVHQYAKTVLEKIKVTNVKILALISQSKLNESINIGLDILDELGFKLPRNPNYFHIFAGFLATKISLFSKDFDYLANLPLITDKYKIAALSILLNISFSAYIVAPNLLAIIVFKQITISSRYGYSIDSTRVFATYGLILCGIFHQIELGYQFGQLSLNLIDKFNAHEFAAKSFYTVNVFINHWKKPLREIIPSLIETYKVGLETGDLVFAAYGVLVYCCYSFLAGYELSDLKLKIELYSETITRLKQTEALYQLKSFHQAIINLLGENENPCKLMGSVYDADVILPEIIKAQDHSSVFDLYFYQQILCYIFGEYGESLENAELARKYINSMTSTGLIPHFYFYDSLARCQLYSVVDVKLQKKYLAQIKANQKKMQIWAHHAPANYLHKFYLVEAEKYRIFNQSDLAIENYSQAINLAKEHEYIHECAIAYELAGRFFLANKQDLIAKTYLQEAHYYYKLWGANAKVKDLENKFSQFFIDKIRGEQNINKVHISNTISVTSNSHSSNLDLATFIKASQAISREIMLDKLLATLMKIVIENAGAQKGYLILENQGKLLIEAKGAVDSDQVKILQSLDVDTCGKVSTAIINYVVRTQETVVLNNASLEGGFTQDIYIQNHQPKSILCLPLINQGKLIAIVYLENNLIIGAFNAQRVEVIKLVTSSAAISLENAKLYQEMRENESRLAQLNQDLEKSLQSELEITSAASRFVPNQFLSFLGYNSLSEVKLGDSVQLEMSVLFSDIRNFTTLSEKMNPQDAFLFINSYLSRMEPIITENQGFIDKYIGDAIMALFSGEADNAVKAGIAMLKTLDLYNQDGLRYGFEAINIGIGIHTGSLMLGTVGGQNRMDGTVISDAVNLASRIEGLTKIYHVYLLITEKTYQKLVNIHDYNIRILDKVQVKGKTELITVYEVFDADVPAVKQGKLNSQSLFEEAVFLYHQGDFTQALNLFVRCLEICPVDEVANIYSQRCQEKQARVKIDVLSRSLELTKIKGDFGKTFYDVLFTDYPQIQVLFANSDMLQQQDKLCHSLEIIVENLNNPRNFTSFLKGLGAIHVKYGVLPEHYPIVGNTIIKAFKVHLGTDWNADFEAAWLDAYAAIQSLMLIGAE
ncbi:AAA family ATPase [Okeanomitos corallinicola TIOX110]|uniref:AAA family ATPase n=1 Tax=Okeanomitos corallinicola TIOX110 TaxID=3133117 RepID=A0ABZ2UNE5_9CYAN